MLSISTGIQKCSWLIFWEMVKDFLLKFEEEEQSNLLVSNQPVLDLEVVKNSFRMDIMEIAHKVRNNQTGFC